MPKAVIDGEEIEFEAGLTVLQVCEQAGREIPRFCYHERLSIAGNCRMCLVEMERAPKPVASCAMPAADGMVVKTDSELVRKARNGVMEFLLINHPLDCPICDQGGECDLQDQAMAYGFDRTRYAENKRAVKDKNLGPLIKTIMTRCIHCTRCVRFSTEVAGVEELGMTARGEDAEIGTYVEKAITSELSGNMIDLCPVGALTSKPYAFAARPWELKKFDSIDVMDAVGSNIRVDCRGPQVMRVLPRLNEDVNEEWISDKARFSNDGLRRQRLDKPYLRGEDGKLRPARWDEALSVVAEKLKAAGGDRVAAIAGDQCDAESMSALLDVMEGLGSPHVDCRQDGAQIGGGPRGSYLFNSTIAGIEEADALLIVGADLRWEAPIIAARVRKRFLEGGFPIAQIGETAVEPTFKVDRLGAGPETLVDLAAGKHSFFKILERAERPMVVLGAGALARPDGAAILGLVRTLADKTGMVGDGWNGFNVLHRAASRVAGLDMGFTPRAGGRDVAGVLDGAADGSIEVVYLLGADELDVDKLDRAFVIYQGHHGDRAAHKADVILPGAAYTEKDGIYANTEGRAQIARRAAFPPGDAKEDWRILRALSAKLGAPLGYDDLSGCRDRLFVRAPSLSNIDQVDAAPWGEFGSDAKPDAAPFAAPVANYWMTDPISRASETMAACYEAFLVEKDKAAALAGAAE